MPICITAQYEVRPEFSKECKQVIQNLVDYVKQNEPGVVLYLAQQDILNPMRFHHTIIFENEAALSIHQSSPASKQFMEALYPKTLAPLDFGEHHIIAYKSGADHNL